MPSKRDILALLTRDELVAIVDQFELEPSSRKTKDALVEAIASSRKATPAEFLPGLNMASLKRVCQGLELNDAGTKPGLVERLASGKTTRKLEIDLEL